MGREWQPKGQPEKVEVHDFASPESPNVIPYGVYDIGKNMGWVNVGADHDTASFAAESIRRWWFGMGRKVYPQCKGSVDLRRLWGKQRISYPIVENRIAKVCPQDSFEDHYMSFSTWNKQME